MTPLLAPELMKRLDQLEILTRKQFAGRLRGEQRSTRKGHSLEFADYRSYVQGDDIRFIDWKIFARLDRLFLKMFMEEEDLFVHFFLDVSHSMGLGEPEKLLYAKKLAAALSYVSLAATHRVSIYPFARSLREPFPSTRGKGQVRRVLRYLERLAPDGETRSLEGFRLFRRRILGAGYVFVITDLLDKAGVEEALKLMLSGRFEVVVFHVLSPDEEEIAWDGEWRLVDVEDGEAVSVSINESFREEYAKTVRAFRGEHKAVCHKLGFQYVPVRTDFPVEALVRPASEGGMPVHLKPKSGLGAEAYEIAFTEAAVTISASTRAGFLYGLITTGQILRGAKQHPNTLVFPSGGTIADEPGLVWRGTHLEDRKSVV